jgi:hypothetical protein
LRFREATQDLVLTIPARAKLIDALAHKYALEGTRQSPADP